MSALLTKALCRIVFPRGAKFGALNVLTAYFDDSGTHSASPVVVIAGFVGTEEQWSAFEVPWREKLANPYPGRPALKRFHMAPCNAQRGEFELWGSDECKKTAADFVQIIVDSGLRGYGITVSRADWDELIQGPMREVQGDAERMCVAHCILSGARLAAEIAPGSPVAFVFDNRPERTKANKRVFDIFNAHSQNPEVWGETKMAAPASISFVSSEKFVPLQAADILAWELNQYGKEWLKAGGPPLPFRDNLRTLTANGNIRGQIATRAAIEKIAAYRPRISYEELAGVINSSQDGDR